MKKIVYAAIAAAFLAGAVSCKFAHVEKELEKPGVSVENGAIIVSVPKRKKTDYINVFRRAAGMEAQKVNIGQITPGEEDSMLSYTFRDALVASGQKYQYALRYKVRSSYMMTDWSAGVTAVSAAATAPAAAVGGGVKLVFDAEAKRLTLSGGTLTPSDAAALAEYTLKIALKTDKKSTLFTLPAAKGTGLADGTLRLCYNRQYENGKKTFRLACIIYKGVSGYAGGIGVCVCGGSLSHFFQARRVSGRRYT